MAIPQTPCTTHITKETKDKIAYFLVEHYGELFDTYKEAIPHIKEHLGVDITYKGIRSIVNCKLFQSIAYE